jgi:hypothetical protein
MSHSNLFPDAPLDAKIAIGMITGSFMLTADDWGLRAVDESAEIVASALNRELADAVASDFTTRSLAHLFQTARSAADSDIGVARIIELCLQCPDKPAAPEDAAPQIHPARRKSDQ